jgi:hypothetical protein
VSTANKGVVDGSIYSGARGTESLKLRACSAVTAVAATDYDSPGGLVGAVEVRDGGFSEAHLARTTPEGRQRRRSQLTRR